MGTEIDENNATKYFDDAVDRLPVDPPPDLGRGRGIVVCGGGGKYLTCAWVCINMLRKNGCALPIELWHLGPKEVPDSVRSALDRLGVTCVDAHVVRKAHPCRILNGWEMKPYAILHSGFQEVLLLDSDNVAVTDPTFLFDSPQYLETGAVFWPDYGRLHRDRSIWRLTGVSYRDEPEVESGQILVDKARCWRAILLTLWMNENSDFWYRHIHGDKETFHMAWRRLDMPYSMPTRPIEPLAGTMCQHDFSGRRLFQHRNLKKWSLAGNESVYGFQFEKECLAFVDELRPFQRVIHNLPPFDPALAAEIAGYECDYHRVGHDRRPLEFLPDGRIGTGSHRMERFWGVRIEAGTRVLEIYGDDGTTARMIRDPRESLLWRGFWVIHERMPIEVKLVKRSSPSPMLKLC